MPTARRRLPVVKLDLGWFHKYHRAQTDHGRALWRNKILLSALPLVKWTADKFPHAGDFDDLCQAGALGLVRAIEKYDEKKGPWPTYAIRWIVHSIQEEIRGSRIVRIPRPSRGPGRTASVPTVSIAPGPARGFNGHDPPRHSYGSRADLSALSILPPSDHDWEIEATARALVAGASDADALILEVLASDHDLADLFPPDEVRGAILRARARLE